MAHVAKYNKASTGNMLRHYDRSATNIGNDKIKKELTYLNYNLAENDQPLPQKEFYDKRLSEINVYKRADVNTMIDWVVTVPKNVLEHDKRKFFEATYDFLSNRYGKENVISSYVHMDETTPHMHYCFVPVIEDKKKGGEKLSAKGHVNRNELRVFHKELDDYVEQELGYTVDILNGATKKGNKAIADLKREQALEDVVKLRADAHEMQLYAFKKSRESDKREIDLNERERALNARESALNKGEHTLSDAVKRAHTDFDSYMTMINKKFDDHVTAEFKKMYASIEEPKPINFDRAATCLLSIGTRAVNYKSKHKNISQEKILEDEWKYIKKDLLKGKPTPVVALQQLLANSNLIPEELEREKEKRRKELDDIASRISQSKSYDKSDDFQL